MENKQENLLLKRVSGKCEEKGKKNIMAQSGKSNNNEIALGKKLYC